MIHVAGNSVVDVLVHGVGAGLGPAEDAWTSGNVHFLDEPPAAVLGGNGGATAYLLGRLGERVSLNTQIGSDVFGEVLRGWMASASVRLTGPPASSSAVNLISVSSGGERRSVYYTGDKVVWRRSLDVPDLDWFYASGYGQATAEDLDELTAVFQVFRSRGAGIAFDPGPWLFAAASREAMLASYREVDCLIGTEAELSTWHPVDGIEQLVEALLDCGPERVVAKRGASGAAFGQRGESAELVPVDPVSGQNTVGAGDTFNAGLLRGIRRGEGLGDAVRTGLRLASETVRRGRGVMGAADALDVDGACR
jgi:sugar/nucleoside kinase (ribokinase family)